MSSILKALEKVEESNNPQRGTGARGFARGRERRPRWVLPAAVLAGAAVAFLATFAAMGGFSRHATPAAQAMPAELPASVATSQSGAVDVVPTVQPKAAASGTAARELIGKTATLSGKPVMSAEPVVAKKTAEAGKVKEGGKQVAAAHKAVSGGRADHPNKSVAGKATAATKAKTSKSASSHVTAHEKKRHTVKEAKEHSREHSSSEKKETKATVKAVSLPASPPPAPSVAHEKARPDLRVTGIAWQKDGASSFAMVNGRSVQQGSTVEGYKVERIFEDKVVFSGSKGKMEVPLGAGE